MTNPAILSGKEASEKIYSALENRISNLIKNKNKPGLAVILVGNDPASALYVRSKTRIFNKLNLYTQTFRFAETVSEVEILNKINDVNNNSSFHGLLVQLPLPKHLNSKKIIENIDPKKDVDGFHPLNAGLLSQGQPGFIPCTPKGIMKIFKYYKINLSGKNVVVLGRSNIVGRPISILTSLKDSLANASTTICHSGTPNIEYFTKNADVIILALGIPKFLKKNMVKKDAIVIDVGINRINDSSPKGYSIVGDADKLDLGDKISAISPVPGGIGPMTIAMLVENTIESAELHCARSSVG